MAEDELLTGCSLEPYKMVRNGNCWWCGAKADSHEHKFKHSDLKRLARDRKEPLVWVGEGSVKNVRSIRKSANVRFRANLCASCNNAKSQPFDRSYEKFSDFTWRLGRKMRWRRSVNWKDVYGEPWREEVLNLGRYVVKHMGCRLDEDGYSVPPEFSSFLEGAPALPSVSMIMHKDMELWDWHKKAHTEGPWKLGLWLGPMEGAFSKAQGNLTMFRSSLTIGFIGVTYQWESNGLASDSFYLHRRATLHRLGRIQ